MGIRVSIPRGAGRRPWPLVGLLLAPAFLGHDLAMTASVDAHAGSTPHAAHGAHAGAPHARLHPHRFKPAAVPPDRAEGMGRSRDRGEATARPPHGDCGVSRVVVRAPGDGDPVAATSPGGVIAAPERASLLGDGHSSSVPLHSPSIRRALLQVWLL